MELEKILRENKKSITKERKLIFSYIKDTHLFSSSTLLTQFPTISRASIFRTLHLFIESGLVRRVSLWDGMERYEIIDGHEHHEHMKCEQCGEILSFDSDIICNEIFKVAHELGFRITQHSLSVQGICKSCQLKSNLLTKI